MEYNEDNERCHLDSLERLPGWITSVEDRITNLDRTVALLDRTVALIIKHVVSQIDDGK